MVSKGAGEEQRMQEGGERHLSSRRIPQPEVAALMHWRVPSIGRERLRKSLEFKSLTETNSTELL